MTARTSILICVFLLSFSLSAQSFFSPILRQDNFSPAPGDTLLILSHANIIVNSETVTAVNSGNDPDTLLLLRGVDYRLEPDNGRILFRTTLDQFKLIRVQYSILPEQFTGRFFYFQPVEILEEPDSETPIRDLFEFDRDSRLTISGSKSISISVGSQRDFNIDQSLYLQIDGSLGKNLNVEAQVTDSESPITPEGDSRELSNLDRILIRLYGDPYEIAFGDLEFPIEDTRYMNYNPRFEGLRASWLGNPSVRAALAVGNGENLTRDFEGIEGKQGSYYLYPQGEITGVQVIPGSEEIYLNGLRMNRGSDYTIDYAEGSLTFSQEHVITSDSRITAIFQYADEAYRKYLYMGGSTWNVSPSLEISSHILHQSDDGDNPLLYSFTSADLDSLAAAGDSEPTGQGAFATDPGQGNYVRLWDESSQTWYYQYTGADSTGNYIVYFTYVGETAGDYIREGTNIYSWVGPGNGSWLPVRKLHAPASRTNWDTRLRYSSDLVEFDLEGIFTVLDKNTFSNLDDDDNDAFAIYSGLTLSPDWDAIRPRLTLTGDWMHRDLATFADIDSASDLYQTGYLSTPDSLDRLELGGSLGLEIQRFFRPAASFNHYRYGDRIRRDRMQFLLNSDQRGFLPETSLNYVTTLQEESDTTAAQSQYLSTKVQYLLLQHLRPGIETLWRQTVYNQNEDSGQKYEKHTARLELLDQSHYNSAIEVSDEKTWTRSPYWEALQHGLTWKTGHLLSFEEHRTEISYSHRFVDYQLSERQDERFDMARLDTQHEFAQRAVVLRSAYQLENREFYKRRWELVPVTPGTGHYNGDGNPVEDGDFEKEYINTGETEMIIDVNAEASLYLDPVATTFGDTIAWLDRIRSESLILVSENTAHSDRWRVYLLDPSVLMQSGSTLYGRFNVRQNLWIDLVPKKLVWSIRYQNDETLDNRYQEEDFRSEETWENILELLGYEPGTMELGWENIRAAESMYNSRSRANVYSFTLRSKPLASVILQSEISWRDESGNTAGDTDSDYRLNSLSVEQDVTAFYTSKVRLFGRIRYDRNDRTGSALLTVLPYKREGNHFSWDLDVSYRLNSYTYTQLTYDGNSHPQRDTVHQLRLEVRAEF